MKIKTTIHIYYNKLPWEGKGEYQVIYAKIDDDKYRTYIGMQEIEIDVPDDYDPRAQQIVALEKQKTKITAEYQKSVTEINRSISELQALEFTP